MSFVGGKSQSGVLQRIINLIPPHEAYIEPFFGSGAVMRFKKPATVNVGIDLEPRPVGLPAWVDFRQESAFDFLERYRWTGGEFVYADPPYVLSSRKRKRACYRFEFTDDDHRRLLTMLKKLPCRVLLSGYPSNLYAGLLPDWHCERFRVMTRGHSWANECLWYNYERPETLHDDRYTGTNYGTACGCAASVPVGFPAAAPAGSGEIDAIFRAGSTSWAGAGGARDSCSRAPSAGTGALRSTHVRSGIPAGTSRAALVRSPAPEMTRGARAGNDVRTRHAIFDAARASVRAKRDAAGSQTCRAAFHDRPSPSPTREITCRP